MHPDIGVIQISELPGSIEAISLSNTKENLSQTYPFLQSTPSTNLSTKETSFFGDFLHFTILLERVEMSAEALASVFYHV